MKTPAGQLVLRTATTFVAFPLVLLLTWVPGWEAGFTVAVGLLASIGLYEYYAIVRMRQISPETIGGIISGTLVVLSGYFGNAALTNLILYGVCLMVAALHIVRGQHSVAGLASSVFGVFYVGWFGAHITLLHSVNGVGAGIVTLLLVLVFVNDTAAYLIGSLAGRHKMAPKVSPNKSWEGAVAGFLGSCACALLFSLVQRITLCSSLPDWSALFYALTGGVVSVVAQIGDLTESCLKRDAGVKDSGALFPGHGGVLDRADGLLLAAPVLYYIVVPLL